VKKLAATLWNTGYLVLIIFQKKAQVKGLSFAETKDKLAIFRLWAQLALFQTAI
jgi:hypothetical protein